MTNAQIEASLPADYVTAARDAANDGADYRAELEMALTEWNEKNRMIAFRKGGKAAMLAAN